jgi:glucose-1-phosphate cytidylyltransferase
MSETVLRATKTVFLAGGAGSRFSKETDTKPKQMIVIGGMPILWHIMKIDGHNYGLTDFIVCLGQKGYIIKEYFGDNVLHRSDVTVDLADHRLSLMPSHAHVGCVTEN